jgi:hypothetical protein
VTLANVNTTCNSGSGRVLDFRVGADGSGEPGFAVPENSVLVVTDWEWCETGNPSAAFVQLAIDGPQGLATVSAVFRESLTATCLRADLGHGVRVASGARLCATPVPAGANLRAHGYLTKDK